MILMCHMPVLLPTPTETIAAKLEAAGNFDTLLELLSATDLLSDFEDPNAGPYTLFAPTDAAFADLLAETGYTIPQLITDFNTLTSILLYHAVDGVFTTDDLAAIKSLETLEGDSIAVDGTTLNSEAQIISADILASNGIIQVIDAVLTPNPVGAATPPPSNNSTATRRPTSPPTTAQTASPAPTGAAGGLDTASPSPTSVNATFVPTVGGGSPAPSVPGSTLAPSGSLGPSVPGGTLAPSVANSTLAPTSIGTTDNATTSTNLLAGVNDTINNLGNAIGGNIGGGTNAAARAENIQL